MPRYDYVCSSVGCNSRQTLEKSYEERQHSAVCAECGSEAKYEFPMGAALGVQILDSYYDEALGCDIKGYRHKRQVMKAQGVIEAGDSVRGARNFDKHAKHHIKPSPPRGVDYAPRIKTDANMNMQVENKKGEWQTPKTKDL